MNPKPPTTPWLRSARWAVALAALACVGVGLYWVYRSAMARDLAGALAGAALCLGVLALDAVAGALLRLGGLVLRSVQRLEAIENRVAALEVGMDALEETLAGGAPHNQPSRGLQPARSLEHNASRTHSKPVDLTTVGSGDVESLVAAHVDPEVFPRLVPQAGESAGASLEPPANTEGPDPLTASITGQRELDHMVRREMERLRAEFAELVRKEDYAAALRTGQRIETLFPDSALAEQFESIRQHLLRRTAGQPPEEPASAI